MKRGLQVTSTIETSDARLLSAVLAMSATRKNYPQQWAPYVWGKNPCYMGILEGIGLASVESLVCAMGICLTEIGPAFMTMALGRCALGPLP